MSKLSEFWTRAKGKVARPWAEAAGDRHAEAKAAVQAETGRRPDEPLLGAVEDEIRRQHNDVDDERD